MSDLGVKLFNPNRLPGLYAWLEDRNFEAIPHSTMADNNGYGRQPIFYIEPSWILDLRQRIYKTYDEKFVYQPCTYSHFVQRLRTDSLFNEDLFLPMYRSLSAFQNREMISYIEGDRIFWVKVEPDETSSKSFAYSLWEGLSLWLANFRMQHEYKIENKIISWNVKLNTFEVPSSIEPTRDSYIALSKKINTRVVKLTDDAIFVEI